MACKLKDRASNVCRFKDALTPVLEELAGFSEEGKHQWRDTHWEEDLHKAYQAGRVIAGCTQKADDGQRPDDGQ